jgi:hypothetical protein
MGQEIIVLQCVQEGDQHLFLHRRNVQFFWSAVEISELPVKSGVVLDVVTVMVYYFTQCRESSIMHVRCCNCNVLKRRYLKGSFVAWQLCNIEQTVIGIHFVEPYVEHIVEGRIAAAVPAAVTGIMTACAILFLVEKKLTHTGFGCCIGIAHS